MKEQADSMMEYFVSLQKVAYEAGLIMGMSIGVSIGLGLGIIGGIMFYKFLHSHFGGKVITRHK